MPEVCWKRTAAGCRTAVDVEDDPGVGVLGAEGAPRGREDLAQVDELPVQVQASLLRGGHVLDVRGESGQTAQLVVKDRHGVLVEVDEAVLERLHRHPQARDRCPHLVGQVGEHPAPCLLRGRDPFRHVVEGLRDGIELSATPHSRHRLVNRPRAGKRSNRGQEQVLEDCADV